MTTNMKANLVSGARIMSLPSKLDVPLEYQENDVSCTPACIRMVLEFIRKNFEGYIPNMTIDEISETVGTDELGTPLENVEKINEKLEKTLPSVEFKIEMNCDFDEIENEILQGKPVIAWIRKPYSHSIVITGIDKDALRLYCNDPETGKQTLDIGRFISAWNKNDNVLIKVKIGEKIQRIIPEYAQRNEKRESN